MDKLKLTTNITPEGLIKQNLINETLNGHNEVMFQWVLDTRETELKKALIYLGWTPPKEIK